MCQRPARLARHEAEALLVSAPVDFVDHSIDLIGELRAPRSKRVEVLKATGKPVHELRFARGAQAQIAQQHQQLALAFGNRCTLDRAYAIEDHLQRTLRGHLRIELPQCASRGVARIHEELLAALARRVVHAAKACKRHEDLPARFK